ncbi:hypothetical protein [Geminicoccus flavidas]|uniref:hypothetical protein n=1 Tax=Geminicoccus flavidas TaxID=2506407 RepID=UPI00135BABE7|nr:hypothetical protein [Geminicoccus flavidas]
MVERLVRYDLTKVLKALDEWPTRSEWWPTTRELILLMDELFTPPSPPALGSPEYRKDSAARIDEQRLLRSPIGQLALQNEVAQSLIEWVRENPNTTPGRNVVDRLARAKVENDRAAALLAGTALPQNDAEQKIRSTPKMLAASLVSFRQAMIDREAELRRRYLQRAAVLAVA